MMRNILIAAAGVLLISPAQATAQGTQQPQQQTQQQQQTTTKNAYDPNEMVCEKQEVLGSRIATQKICKTRGEWADQRRTDRMEIDKMQTQRGCSSKGC